MDVEYRDELIEHYLEHNKNLRIFTDGHFDDMVEDIKIHLDNKSLRTDREYVLYICDTMYSKFLNEIENELI